MRMQKESQKRLKCRGMIENAVTGGIEPMVSIAFSGLIGAPLLYLTGNDRRHIAGYRPAISHSLSDHAAAHVEQRTVDDCYTWGQTVGIDRCFGSRIDGNVVMTHDFFMVEPSGEISPIVAADEQNKRIVGVTLPQCLQGVPCIGRLLHAELEVARHELRMIFECHFDQLETLLPVEHLSLRLQRVLGCHHKPHFIERELLQKMQREGDVTVVDGVERAPEDAYPSVHGCSWAGEMVTGDGSVLFQKGIDQPESVFFGTMKVVIDDHVIEFFGKPHLIGSLGYSVLNGFRRVGASCHQPFAKFVDRWRLDKNAHGAVAELLLDGTSAFDIDIKDDVLTGSQLFFDLGTKRTVKPAGIYLFILQKRSLSDTFSERFGRKEEIFHPVLFGATGCSAGATDGKMESEFLVFVHEPLHDGAFSCT